MHLLLIPLIHPFQFRLVFLIHHIHCFLMSSNQTFSIQINPFPFILLVPQFSFEIFFKLFNFLQIFFIFLVQLFCEFLFFLYFLFTQILKSCHFLHYFLLISGLDYLFIQLMCFFLLFQFLLIHFFFFLHAVLQTFVSHFFLCCV